MKNSSYSIPVYKPLLKGNEAKYVADCMNTGWISSKGEYVNKFESELSKYINTDYVSVVSNGTVALHLALLALGIKRGDEVIVPNLTYVATANAVKYVGAKPVFVDIDPTNWQIDPEKILRKITSRTKAIMVVHLYGYSAEIEKIANLAKSHNLYLVEDCAEALGTRYNGIHVGNFGDIGTFSFYGNKTITTGEGGAICTKSTLLYNKIQKLKGQGLAINRQYWHDVVGYNYRMTNICAAIGLAQLEQIEEKVKEKKDIYNTYYKSLKKIKEIRFPEAIVKSESSYWMITILLEPNGKRTRDGLINYLSKFNIETRPTFYPLTMMPIYSESDDILLYPNSYYIGLNGINLPSWPGITKKEVDYIIEKVMQYINYESKNN